VVNYYLTSWNKWFI